MSKAHELKKLADQVAACTQCKLAQTRNHTVFGDGSPDARLVFIGEGPGRDEDDQGRPFVGRAGKLLTAVIENHMGLNREDVYIANVIKCRATADQAQTRDRPPDAEEIALCSPYLLKQLDILRPSVIVTLGNPAARFLLKTREGITRLRGHWHPYEKSAVMPTYHPSYLLRNGGENSRLGRDLRADMRKVMKYLEADGEGEGLFRERPRA